MPPLRRERQPDHPIVIAGGPLTFSNPAPLLPFVDVLICGEGEGLIKEVLQRIEGEDKASLSALLSEPARVVVATERAPVLLPVAKADDVLLPAHSAIVAESTELRKMFLIEPERGCSRQCTYCVMRRSTNGGMRPVPAQAVLDAIPQGVERVGLVGAAVTDHREITDLVNALADRDLSIGISSLRAGRLKRPLLEALFRGGYRTVTVALDGASPRLRRVVRRKTEDQHIERVAREAKSVGFMKMKIYMVLGLPTEHDEDLENLAHELIELSKILPIVLILGCPNATRRFIAHLLSASKRAIGGLSCCADCSKDGLIFAPSARAGAGWSRCSALLASMERCLRRIGEAVTTRPTRRPLKRLVTYLMGRWVRIMRRWALMAASRTGYRVPPKPGSNH